MTNHNSAANTSPPAAERNDTQLDFKRPSPLVESPPPALNFPASNDSTQPPPGMDAASFMAGECAAYSRAFAAALPAQQAIGRLFQAVDTLHERLEAEAATVRELKTNYVKNNTTMEIIERNYNEIVTKPALSPEVAEALEQLENTLSQLSAVQHKFLTEERRTSAGYVLNQLKTLAATASGLATATLTKADVAAVFLSRKLLVGDAQISSNSNGRVKLGYAVAGALFVGVIEAAWQIQQQFSERVLPRVLRPVNAPLRYGLKIARTAAWSAAFVLAANEVRKLSVELAAKLTSSTISAEQHTSKEEETCYSPSLASKIADIESQGGTPSSLNSSTSKRRPVSPIPPTATKIDNDLFETPKKKPDLVL